MLIAKHGLQNVLSVSGKDCWSFLNFKDGSACSQWDLKTLFLQEVYARGILIIGTHNMSFAHSDSDIASLLDAYNEALQIIRAGIEQKDLKKRLRAETIVPLFKIR